MISIPSTTQAKQDNNQYFVGDPEITFFKSVFKRHTNFAIESFDIPFEQNTTLFHDSNKKFICKIPKFGDLLGKVFLRLSVPPMKTTNDYKFQFNDNFGLSIIEELSLKINGVLIEKLDAKILYTLYKLHHTDEEQKQFKDLINGNIHNNIYVDTTDTSTLHSTTYVNKYYNSPVRTENDILFVPLDFAFTHFYKTYVPLFLLENKAVEIEVTLRSMNDMFTIEVFEKDYWYYDKDTADYKETDNPLTSALLRSNALDNTDMSDTSITSTSDTMLYGEQTSAEDTTVASYPYYLQRYESRKRIRRRATDPNINAFTYNSAVPFSLEPSLQVEQIFLTKEEKYMLSNQSTEILIQQIHKKEFSNIKGNQTQTILVENHSNLIKELIIIVERNDNDSRNQFLNFTNYEHAGLNEDSIRKYQDNWWYDASGNESISVDGVATTQTTNGTTSSNELVFASPHGFSAGVKVVYNDNSATTVTGLTSGTTYYVLLSGTSTSQMKLEATIGGGNIITGGGAAGNTVTFSKSVTINGGTKSFTITNDTFQDFLFKYGPYGEASHGNNDGGANWTSNKIQPQYQTYTIEEIDEFRKIWQYRDISNNIPIINSANFSTTFSGNPLVEIDMLFDGTSREEIKESQYFNKINPYLYHTNDADPGVYTYSFSIDPEAYQPSGFCNMNVFRKIQYKLTLNQTELKPEHEKTTFIDNYNTQNASKKIIDYTLYIDNTNPQKGKGKERLMTTTELTDEAMVLFNPNVYDYNIFIYSLKYNFITIKDKLCTPLYSLSQ